MTSRRPVLLAVESDLHANSTMAPCPPVVRLHDGGQYRASKLQTWLRECREDAWRRVGELRREVGAELWVVTAGDMYDGIGHHGTIQNIGFTAEAETYIVKELCAAFRALKPQRYFVVRGTQSHVGTKEEWLGEWLGAEREPIHGNWSSHVWLLEIHGWLVDCRHHGRVGYRPWTKLGAVGNLSAHVAAVHVEAGWRVPDLCIRAHRHQYVDTGPHTRPRVIQTPPWQAKTDWAEQRVPEEIPEFGVVAVLFHKNRRLEVYPMLYRPDPPTPWRPA